MPLVLEHHRGLPSWATHVGITECYSNMLPPHDRTPLLLPQYKYLWNLLGLSTCGCHLWWECELHISVILTIVLIIVFNMIDRMSFQNACTKLCHMHLNIMLFTWTIANTISFTLSYLHSFIFFVSEKENMIVNTYADMIMKMVYSLHSHFLIACVCICTCTMWFLLWHTFPLFSVHKFDDGYTCSVVSACNLCIIHYCRQYRLLNSKMWVLAFVYFLVYNTIGRHAVISNDRMW